LFARGDSLNLAALPNEWCEKMAFESCPECNAEKHQLVKCPQCGFQRNPHKGPIIVDVQPQREHVSRQRENIGRQRDDDGQQRQRRSQHGLRNDHRRDDRQSSAPHPNSYEYQQQDFSAQQPRQKNGNSVNDRRRSGPSKRAMQPRHNQFGQPIGGAMQSVGSDQLREPRKPAKAAVITYKRKPRIVRSEPDSAQP
jgi:hypothetical protein